LLKAKAKAKDLTFKAKAKAKDSKCVLEDTSRPRTKAKDNNTGCSIYYSTVMSLTGPLQATSRYFTPPQ